MSCALGSVVGSNALPERGARAPGSLGREAPGREALERRSAWTQGGGPAGVGGGVDGACAVLRFTLAAGLVGLLSGCSLGIALCAVNADCGPGARCDSSAGVCVNAQGGEGGGTGALDAGQGDAGVAPQLELLLPPLLSRPALGGAVYDDVPLAFARGDRLAVALRSALPLTGAALRFGGVDAVAVPAAACATLCLGQCACFEVDLARPPLPGLRGGFAVAGSATTAAGTRLQVSGTIPVTRLRWQRVLGDGLRGTPAVGRDGTVYLGTLGAEGEATGAVLALSSNGQEVWSRALGRVVGSVLLTQTATGALRVYAGTVGEAPAVSALDAQGLTVAQCRLQPDARLEASPAAVPEGAVFYANGTQRLIALRPGAPSACVEQPAGAGMAYPDAVVSAAGSVYFVDREPTVRRFFVGFGFVEFKQGQWPGEPQQGYESRGLALPRRDTLVGAGALPGGGAVFQASVGKDFRFDFGFAPSRIAQRGSGPVVSADGLVLLGVGDTLTAISSSTTRAAPSDRLANTPALGEGGRLYALAERGALSEWTYAGGTPLLRWSAQLAPEGPVAFEASPALDCARSREGLALPGRPGVLYAAASFGTLYAVTVDARGLDTRAQWPKYQRDRRNSGSSDGTLDGDACP